MQTVLKRTPLWLAVGLLFALTACRRSLLSDTQGAIAVYDHMALEGNPSFECFLTGTGGDIADVYVQLNDGRAFHLPEFPEAVAESLFPKIVINPNKINYSDYKSQFIYRDGNLDFVALDAVSGKFSISPWKDGPFVRLPISREKMIELFGEPKEWHRAGKLPTGP
jgi:hypothetical protein